MSNKQDRWDYEDGLAFLNEFLQVKTEKEKGKVYDKYAEKTGRTHAAAERYIWGLCVNDNALVRAARMSGSKADKEKITPAERHILQLSASAVVGSPNECKREPTAEYIGQLIHRTASWVTTKWREGTAGHSFNFVDKARAPKTHV